MLKSGIKNVTLVKPRSVGGNFEYSAIPVQGLPYLSAALKQHAESREGPKYDTRIWFEDHYNLGKIDPVKDLEDTDLLIITGLLNEIPRASEIIRQAKAAHPNIKIMGGGPYMGPVPDDALEDGVDVVVDKEGEMVIGTLADILLSERSENDITKMLERVGGIAYMQNGNIVKTPIDYARLNTPPDYVKLPDFDAMMGVDKKHPMLAGVLETSRGCTENCDFCEVIQHFKGYRRISYETEVERLKQLRQLADEGKIYTNRKGEFSTFITNDLHFPPGRATKFRDEVLERTKLWKQYTEGMYFTAQVRAEAGQDPELLDAFAKVGGRMMYIGVESLSQSNLDLVQKRQRVDEIKRDLLNIKSNGYMICAMLIMGLPEDTEESLMQMAEDIQHFSNYQTHNFITPLPGTRYWNDMVPLDEDGSLLPEGKRRPLQLYTGRQLVIVDPVSSRGWSMDDSRRIEEEFRSNLRHVDTLYGRMYNLMHKEVARR